MRRADLRAALVIAARIIRQRLRDRSALLFAVVTPIGLALAFSTLIPNDFAAFHTDFVIVDNDQGPSARVLIDDAFGQVAAAGIADISMAPSEAAALQILHDGNAGAVIVVPAGFSNAVEAGQPTQIRVLGGQFPTSLEVARAVVSRFAADIGAVQLMVSTARADGATVDARLVQAAVDAAHEPSPIITAADPVARRQAGLGTFYGAAMAIMFVFFATQYGALAIHADRQAGTLARLLAAPVSSSAILLGTSLAGFLLGLVSMTVLVVATTYLVGASWGDPALVALLIVAAVVAAMGFSTLVATLARTPQQAGALNAIVALALASLGGVFLPLSEMPSSLVTVSQITPHAWFLRGIDTLADPAAGVADIAPSLIVLLAMGVALTALGLARARRSLVLA